VIAVREATPADNQGLLVLTQLTPMDGPVAIRIDRHPDFFTLLRLRGAGKTFVAVDEDEIIGCCSITYRTAFVNAQARTVGYLSDLKIRPSHRGGRAIVKLLQTGMDYMATQDVNLYVCVTSSGNEPVSSVLKERLSLPVWRSTGSFNVYQMMPGCLPKFKSRYAIAEATNDKLEEVCGLCNTFNSSYQLAPVLDQNDFGVTTEAIRSLPARRVLTARRNGVLVATLSAFDLAGVKQITIVRVPFLLRRALDALRLARSAVPFFASPMIGAQLKMLYLRNVAYVEGHEAALRALLRHVRRDAFRERYTFVTVGVHERDPMRFMVSGVPRYAFKSIVRVATFAGPNVGKDSALINDILSGVPMEDFAIV
jgi:hypothetical protein